MADGGHEGKGPGDDAQPVIPDFETEEALVAFICSRLDELGLTDFCLFADERNKRVRGVFCRTTPNQFHLRYIKLKCYPVDPVVLRLRTATAAFTWSSLDFTAMSARQLAIFDVARKFAFRNGVAVPLPLPNRELAIFTTYSTREDISDDTVVAVGDLARQAMAGYIQISGGAIPELKALSEREQEVLTWAARGKSNAEIAIILTLSDKTVEYHWLSIRKKLNASNRTMAVAIAIARSLIHP
ncbi:autoinducer binding domain-containing protein [Zavarzinia sp. CC-PAN008]|uniref:autoinducer binding domain-containing protein n=1 Tax=Zavarzinia sp. CC-PAN008 TaxID=3243332 RepID=UPI003F745977